MKNRSCGVKKNLENVFEMRIYVVRYGTVRQVQYFRESVGVQLVRDFTCQVIFEDPSRVSNTTSDSL